VTVDKSVIDAFDQAIEELSQAGALAATVKRYEA
jgi:hypothetical protein